MTSAVSPDERRTTVPAGTKPSDATSSRKDGAVGRVLRSIRERRDVALGSRRRQALVREGLDVMHRPHRDARVERRGARPSVERPVLGGPGQPRELVREDGARERRALAAGLEGERRRGPREHVGARTVLPRREHREHDADELRPFVDEHATHGGGEHRGAHRP